MVQTTFRAIGRSCWLGLSLLWAAVVAADPYLAPSGWQLGMAVGAGRMANPLRQHQDIPLFLLPRVEYFQGDFALVNTSLAWTPVQGNWGNLGLVSQLNQDGIYFQHSWRATALAQFRLAPQAGPTPDGPGPSDGNKGDMAGIASRHLSYLGGLEWSHDLANWHLAVTWLRDLTAVHHGTELWFKVEYPWQAGAVSGAVGAELLHQDARLLGYYYGTGPAQLAAGFSRYQPAAAVSSALKVRLHYAYNDDFTFISDLKFQQLGSGIRHSPLLDDPSLWSVFIGIAHVF